jgi:hypothetical protein
MGQPADFLLTAEERATHERGNPGVGLTIPMSPPSAKSAKGGDLIINYELWILNYEWESFKTWRSGVLAVKFHTVFEASEGASAHANNPHSCVATRRYFLACHPIPTLKRGPMVMRRQCDILIQMLGQIMTPNYSLNTGFDARPASGGCQRLRRSAKRTAKRN